MVNRPNGSTIEGYDDFNVDYGRALHWAAIRSGLPERARHVVHIIASFMPKDGSGCWPGYRLLADATGIPLRTINRLMPELMKWEKLAVTASRGCRGNTYKVNISKEEALTQWCRKQQAKISAEPIAVPSDGTTKLTSESNTSVVMPSGGTTNNSGAMNDDLVVPNENLVVPNDPVAVPSSGTILLDSKRLSRRGDVLSISPNLSPFGEWLPHMLRDMLLWKSIDIKEFNGIEAETVAREALVNLTCMVGIYGSLNVLEAWNVTARATGKKAAYFGKVLQNLLTKHGKRDISPEVDRGMTAHECRMAMFGRDGL